MTAARRQQGLVLPILIVLLSLGGLGWLLAHADNGADRAARNLKRETQTTRALEMARDALLGFAANYRNGEHPNADFGYLPCPDLDGDGSAETCGTKGQPSIGRLPYLTLNLPDLRDGSGECLWYAVSGSFKNNPKADTVNWDSIGEFRLIDRDGHPITLPGDQQGLAAAIVFAPGPPLPQQHRTAGQGRCGDGPGAQLEHYLEVLGNTGNGIVDVHLETATNNDRLVSLTSGEIFDQLKRRSDYAQHLQTNLQAVADCLEKTGLPIPPTPQHHGPLQLGNVPPLSTLSGSCTHPEKRDAASNWSELMRYGRCSSGSACLTSPEGPCRGVLLFGGERRSTALLQQRISPQDKLMTTQYLEASTLTALSAGQLHALPAQISVVPNSTSPDDIALCLP
ncbi:hypothetical protein [Zoogloea sp. LCSB751]|uniref:hypothetical protein n=1 Tax=Zoogloea sp. LCSB751 TaxID=1965277 RepID=UPI0013747A57|nr:hypothetical protein [Zoogloea sp. LCSB751]